MEDVQVVYHRPPPTTPRGGVRGRRSYTVGDDGSNLHKTKQEIRKLLKDRARS